MSDSLFNLSIDAAQVHQLIDDSVGWYVLDDEMPRFVVDCVDPSFG